MAILLGRVLLQDAQGTGTRCTDLIGGGCDALIPAHPPKGAIEERRRRANDAAKGDHYQAVANPAKGESAGERGLPNQGYRPGRKTQQRRQGKKSR